MDYKSKLVKEIYSEVSGNFLTCNVPLDFLDWEEDKRNDFLKENAWELFQDWEIKAVWELIDCSATILYDWYAKKHPKEITTC